MKTLCGFLLLFLCLFAELAFGTIRRVPSQYATIQTGINAAVHGDTVLVSDGYYTENIRFRGKRIVVASLYLTDGDTAHKENTIIDGSSPSHPDSGSVVYFVNGEDTTSVLCGFTIGGGTGTVVTIQGTTVRAGGGILVRSGARICHNIITQNQIIAAMDAYGGGIETMSDNLSFTIIDSNRITDNVDSSTTALVSGGGIDVTFGNGRIIGNTIRDNRTGTHASSMCAWAAGIALFEASYLVSGNLVERNMASAPNCTIYPSWGGGVIAVNTKLDFVNNRVTDNIVESSVGGRGGGISVHTESTAGLREVLLSRNYIASNRAVGGVGRGGGVFIFDQRPRLENNIIVKNSAEYGGGFGCQKYFTSDTPTKRLGGKRLTLRGPSVEIVKEELMRPDLILNAPVLINNTIAYNKATSGAGGGIWSSGSWTPIVLNTIVWGDTCTQEIYLASGEISINYSDIQGGWPSGIGNINADPRFALPRVDLFQDSTSPCINAGRDTLIPCCRSDYHGHIRPWPVGRPPDIGVEEYGSTVGVNNPRELPQGFVLSQNYPNPFNPVTNFQFSIANRQLTILKLYDVLGREVATLVNEVKQPGTYTVQWNASGVASGVYFYRIQAGDFIASKKLLLLK